MTGCSRRWVLRIVELPAITFTGCACSLGPAHASAELFILVLLMFRVILDPLGLPAVRKENVYLSMRPGSLVFSLCHSMLNVLI